VEYRKGLDPSWNSSSSQINCLYQKKWHTTALSVLEALLWVSTRVFEI